MKKKQLFLSLGALSLCLGLGSMSVMPGGILASANEGTNEYGAISYSHSLFEQGETEVDVVYFPTATSYNLSNQYTDRVGLGYSINAITNSYIDATEIRDGAPIFDSQFHNNTLLNAIYATSSSTITNACSASDMGSMSTALSNTYGFSASISGGYELFSGEAEYAYTIVNSIESQNYYSQYYYKFYSEYVDYTYALPNYASNLTVYKNNLDSDYRSAVTNLLSSNSAEERDQFFNTYGTHVIAKAKYGGKIHAYYNAASNQIDVGHTYRNKLSNHLSAGLGDLVEAGTNTSFSFETATDFVAGSYVDRFFATTRGGQAFSSTSMEGFKSAFVAWQNSIEDRPGLIGVTSDGLVPLWNLLPTQYDTVANRTKMRNLYLAYAQDYSTDYSRYNSNDTGSVDIGTFCVRNGEKTITDAGRFVHNIYDAIDFNSKSRYGISVLKNMGYSRMNITINLDMKEVDKGYQYIFIYNGSARDDTLLDEKKIELGGTNKQSTYINQTYTFDIPLDGLDLKNPYIVIRYGASGSNEDNWCNKNVKMGIRFY